ncbi:MAG: integrase arm-type DNA-binding domain-containing protein [Alphaproteobacteria bacterium]|nr:integrase arm-type DNA-binding domain-containing protein [Alphaproteobacteria bacterium]MDX5368652.1 integrase arm-type DNA-binding domain-containing protein [Alphaproteobacteria bacterium]MDX5463397.1 integrase arm-type DNA-binding domain-containing protein [Alphaproteobacteria bacterium]
MPLTDVRIRALKPAEKPVKHSDGGGLYLRVTPQGSRLWRVAYRFHGLQKTLALGAYPVVSLAEARSKLMEARKLLADGIDPSTEKKSRQLSQRLQQANSFDAIAAELMEKARREGRAAATLKKKAWLLGLARPAIGHRPIAEISAAEILAVLREVEAKGNYETARRLRATIGQVFRFAIATARAENDPTGALRGALINPVVQHRAALTSQESFAGLVRAIWDYEGSPVTRAALRLMALLYPRPGELRMAEWPEFDLDEAVWVIPAARAKMRRAHRKPLPPDAVEILRDVRAMGSHSRFVFPAMTTIRRPMSENTLNVALRRLGFDKTEASAHGFRASASSLLNESGLWHPDAIEAELGHVGADAVRKAYHRASYWDERVRMGRWWADELRQMRGEGD